MGAQQLLDVAPRLALAQGPGLHLAALAVGGEQVGDRGQGRHALLGLRAGAGGAGDLLLGALHHVQHLAHALAAHLQGQIAHLRGEVLEGRVQHQQHAPQVPSVEDVLDQRRPVREQRRPRLHGVAQGAGQHVVGEAHEQQAVVVGPVVLIQVHPGQGAQRQELRQEGPDLLGRNVHKKAL